MELFLIILGCVVVWLAYTTAKEMLAESERRANTRFMEDYFKAEEARAHRRRLAEINATVRKTNEELDRIAAEAQGEIIEGTCSEIEVRR